MSRSNKSRYGQRCKFWKDTVLGSRNQKRAWSKRKQIETQAERTGAKAEVRAEVETDRD
jgi:hypothetical protein